MKSSEIVALIIGRGNNTLKDKNILPVLGRPLLHWGGMAALNSQYIGRYYISSDCNKILDAGTLIGFAPIKRPDYLATPIAQSSDAIIHALNTIENEGICKILVVIHANVGTISSKMIDDCISILLQNNEASSVIPSHKKDEYHPLRARKINKNGMLEPFVENYNKEISANRQDLEKCLFYDHSFWVLDINKGVKSTDGQKPWPVMGKNIIPYITEGCFDVHNINDLQLTEKWILENNIEYNKIAKI